MTGKLKRDNVIHWTIIIGISNFYNVFLGTFSIMFGRHSGTYAQGVAMGKTECVIRFCQVIRTLNNSLFICSRSLMISSRVHPWLLCMWINLHHLSVSFSIIDFLIFCFVFLQDETSANKEKPQKNYNTENDSRSAGLFAGSWRHTSTL